MALAGEELRELGPERIDAAELGGDGREAEICLRLGRGDAQRPRLVLRPHLRVRPDQRGVHDVRHDQRRGALHGDDGSVETLLEALPYIREFHGRTVVIKYGGAAMRDEALREDFATDVVLLKYVGLNPVIVHGGGPEITRLHGAARARGPFHEGLRVSDAETVEVAKMVLLGKLNSDIVQRLNRHGQPAVGLSGEDGALFEVAPGRRTPSRSASSARSSGSTSTSSTTSPPTTSR